MDAIFYILRDKKKNKQTSAAMLRSILMSTVSVTVGICALTVLDAQLGNLSQVQFETLVKNRWLRGMTLFAAAYASNGNHLVPALLAVYIYFMLTDSDATLGYLADIEASPTSPICTTACTDEASGR